VTVTGVQGTTALGTAGVQGNVIVDLTGVKPTATARHCRESQRMP
jgi:hypothetical protein